MLRVEITFAAGLTPRDKSGVPCAFWGFGPFFLKRTVEGSNRYNLNCRHNSDSAAGFCPFKQSRLALSEKYCNVLLTCMFFALAVPLCRAF